jgi:hypothetical protein
MPDPDALGVALPTPIVVANFPTPVNVLAPLALRVPVTATPALVTATTVEPPLCMFKSPLASEVTITPPPPDVEAFIELAIYISYFLEDQPALA